MEQKPGCAVPPENETTIQADGCVNEMVLKLAWDTKRYGKRMVGPGGIGPRNVHLRYIHNKSRTETKVSAAPELLADDFRVGSGGGDADQSRAVEEEVDLVVVGFDAK